jgi:4,5-DOPA dioxygenase extradiol
LNRKEFLNHLAILPIGSTMIKLSELEKHVDAMPLTPSMPMLFLGHGSPMNAIEENQFVRGFRHQALSLPKPKAILCISAHWFTKGTMVTSMEYPKTIHDFGGFPKELFEVQYPAPGSPQVANETIEALSPLTVKSDLNWGLDHGAWSVLIHLFPKADIPVVQLSLDYTQGPSYHFELAKRLKSLREKGILIVGSGNLIHNLGLADFGAIDKVGYGYDWAIESRSKMNDLLVKGNFNPLVNYTQLGKAVQMAIPTPDHYLPLLYILGLKHPSESLSLFNDELLAGSLSMTSVRIG